MYDIELKRLTLAIHWRVIINYIVNSYLGHKKKTEAKLNELQQKGRWEMKNPMTKKVAKHLKAQMRERVRGCRQPD